MAKDRKGKQGVRRTNERAQSAEVRRLLVPSPTSQIPLPPIFRRVGSMEALLRVPLGAPPIPFLIGLLRYPPPPPPLPGTDTQQQDAETVIPPPPPHDGIPTIPADGRAAEIHFIGAGTEDGYKPFKLCMKLKKDPRIQTSNVFATPPDSPEVPLPIKISPPVKLENVVQRM